MSQPTRILLTGPPGSGKTTVILRTVELLGRRCAGFYTEEVRARGARIGFDVVALDGKRGALARVGGGGPRVGKYGVDIASFEEIGVRALEAGLRDPARLLIVDEMGKMEFSSDAFVALLPRLFRAPNPLLGTVLARAHRVADRYRGAPGVEIVQVTKASRERLPQELAQRLGG
ncbi:MAG: hypothetical protein HY561_00160 [Gemmatimonadetes bacterium]|nr:hypothetical protein [Gemmatimonadota bacterium]